MATPLDWFKDKVEELKSISASKTSQQVPALQAGGRIK